MFTACWIKVKPIVAPQEHKRSYLCLAVWLVGAFFTLLKGIDRNPWGVGIFDLDLLTLLTGYLFLSFGHIQAGAFALGQGLLIDVFSVGPNGLSALVYVSVFWGIYLGSLFFNFHTVKGQIIIISLIVFFKHAMWQAVTGFFLDNTFISISFLCATAVSVVGTGLLTPVLYGIFDRLRGVPGGEEESPDVEELNNPLWENNR